VPQVILLDFLAAEKVFGHCRVALTIISEQDAFVAAVGIGGIFTFE
jgi:hypothetical protein